MTTVQGLYGKGRFDGRIQGILGTLFFAGIALALFWVHNKKQQEILT